VSSGAYEHQFGQQERVVEQLPAHPFGLLAAVQMIQIQYAGVDYSGKDLVRACFLSHDEGALMRVKTPMG